MQYRVEMETPGYSTSSLPSTILGRYQEKWRPDAGKLLDLLKDFVRTNFVVGDAQRDMGNDEVSLQVESLTKNLQSPTVSSNSSDY